MRHRRLRVSESEPLILALSAMVTESQGRWCYRTAKGVLMAMPPAIEARVHQAMLVIRYLRAERGQG